MSKRRTKAAPDALADQALATVSGVPIEAPEALHEALAALAAISEALKPVMRPEENGTLIGTLIATVAARVVVDYRAALREITELQAKLLLAEQSREAAERRLAKVLHGPNAPARCSFAGCDGEPGPEGYCGRVHAAQVQR